MAKVLIDNHQYEATEGKNLLESMLSLGLDLPYFCWHPELGSVGSCRQCAVTQYADENDERGRVVMACMTPVQEGMRVGLQDAQSAEFRAEIIEALMINHPHDCPVCEEGGECHLQDMTEMSGHTFRRFRGLKRTHRNQDLGPFINHEMNRCIACYRCVRFYRDYAGGTDLSAQAAHHHVYFGRERDGVLESPFSGNLAEVCPTGVFTDRTYSDHYARKWDLQTAPSVCAHCAVGCNTTPAERYGRIVRVTNRYHHDLNGYFLCDRGRFGYDYSNVPRRVGAACRPAGDGEEPLDREAVWADLLARIDGPDHIVFAVGSPRASMEDNYALQALVGRSRFFAGVADDEWRCLQYYRSLAAGAESDLATVRDVEDADAALIVGEDIAGTAPRVALALRQMVRNEGIAQAVKQGVPAWQDAAVRAIGGWYRTPLWQLVPHANGLSDVTENACYETPEALARVARAVAAVLSGGRAGKSLTKEQQQWAKAAAEMLRRAERPLLVGGCGLGDVRQLEAVGAIASALTKLGRTPRLYLAALESNSAGLAALTERGLTELMAMIDEAHETGRRCSLVILENDLQRRLPPATFEILRQQTDHWLVLDHLMTPTARRADAVIPVPTPFEKQGTLVNASGIAQRFYAVRHNPGCESAWRQIGEAVATGEHRRHEWQAAAVWRDSDDVRDELAEAYPAFADIGAAGPDADYRHRGRKLLRQPHRYSGRTAINAHRHVSEAPPPADETSPYCFSMEGSWGEGPWRAAVWAPGWNSGQALNKFQQEVGGQWRNAPPTVRVRFEAGGEAPRTRGGGRAAAPETGDWLAVPRHDIFGSEELSAYAAAVVERAGPPMLGLDTASAGELGLKTWDSVELHCGDDSETLHVYVDETLPAHTVSVPQQRLALSLIFTDPALRLSLRPAANPLPRPPEIITSDHTGGAHA